MDLDLASRLDRSIGPAPDHDLALAGLLEQGHRAVRRRRAGALVASAVAVAVVAVGAGSLAGRDSDRTAPVTGTPSPPAPASVTPNPTASPDPGAEPPSPAEIQRVLHHDYVEIGDHGQPVVTHGTVVRRLDNPFGLAPPAASLGVELRVGNGRYWYAWVLHADGSANGASIWSGSADLSFAAWVQSQSALADDATTVGPGVWPDAADLDLVTFDGDTERLVARAGTTILEQRAHVSVGASFAGPGDQTAAARVRTADGTGYYVLARRFDGKPGQYIAVPVADGGSDLQAFLELARARYAAGGGGLL